MTDRSRRVSLGTLVVAALLAGPAAATDITASGSASVDYWLTTSEAARNRATSGWSGITGFTAEAAFKLEADVHEKLSVTVRACFGCHGLEIDRAHIDYTPSVYFNVQAGRIGVPFGEMSIRYDPSSHRSISKPLIYEMGRMAYYTPNAFNLGVVPQPYVETGAVVYGQLEHKSLVVWYGGYVVAGLRGNNDFDYRSMRTPFYIDNNDEPAGGGRVVFTVSPNASVVKDVQLGASGMFGRYDSRRTLKYTALGLDASARIGSLTLRTEAAFIRVDMQPDPRFYRYRLIDTYMDKGGFFVEAEHPIGSHLMTLYRFDVLARKGNPLLESVPELSPDSRIYRYTQAFQILLSDSVHAKVSYEYWHLTDFPDFHSVHLGFAGSF